MRFLWRLRSSPASFASGRSGWVTRRSVACSGPIRWPAHRSRTRRPRGGSAGPGAGDHGPRGPGAPALTLAETDSVFAAIGATTGPGSQAERRRLLGTLFARATPAEQSFLTRLLAGELHQGALEGVMVEAVARAAGVDAGEVRRALLLGGSLPAVAEAALSAASATGHDQDAADQASPGGEHRGGRPRGAPGLPAAGGTALAADAGRLRPDRGRRLRPGVPGRGGMEDRRDPDPGPPARARGHGVHPDPGRHHRPAPRDHPRRAGQSGRGPGPGR